MSEQIEAIYENGLFRPLEPVDLPEGTRVHIATDPGPAAPDEQARRELIASGAAPADIERILANFHLLWSSYDTLNAEEKEQLEQARLDQRHFFDHLQSSLQP
ncbi:MAG: antitoxin family protein [Blastocatellia bacterium]